MTAQRTPLTGRCLCGAVRFTAVPSDQHFGACHCGMCRRWTAGPFLAVDCGGSVEIKDGAPVGVYKSSDWAERQFCQKCGTPLFYKLTGHDFYVVSLEALDDPSSLKFTSEIFIDEKPAYYDFANDTTKKTGAQVFAEFAASQGTGE